MLKEKLNRYQIYLASKSPRRFNLMKGLDIDFKLMDINVDEVWPIDYTLLEIPEYLAVLKSQSAMSGLSSNDLVITADTAVFYNNEILNKPKDKSEAIKMLSTLSGKMHSVVTGVCIRTLDKMVSFSDRTDVYFNDLTEQEILYYIENYEPFDKAGSYGAQDWIGYIGIKKLEGSYYNVMGLPVRLVYRELLNFF